jgi:hypothetical protein
MDIQRLRLINVRSSIGRHVNDALLTDLPYCPVDGLEICWQVWDCGKSQISDRTEASVEQVHTVLNRTLMSNDEILEIFIPQTAIDEFSQEPRVDNLEFASEDTASVDVARVRFKALVEP